MIIILQALYYFLPAYFSNMAPVILSKLNIFPQPVDFGKMLSGQPLFGSHKTWGGLIYATVFGTLVFYIQQLLYQYPFFQRLSLFDYTAQPLLLGITLAAGAILGDLIKSFIKRRLSRKPGSPWVPWDQLDLVIGAFVLSAPIYLPKIWVILTIFIITPLLHYGTSVLGYYLGLKRNRW